jgi:hypothetical protein
MDVSLAILAATFEQEFWFFAGLFGFSRLRNFRGGLTSTRPQEFTQLQRS